MISRDELAVVIRRKYDQHPVDRYPTEHALADWILSHFTVVELPEPDREPLTYNGAGWTVPAPHHQVFDGYFQIESSDSEFGDEDKAEAFALALLACARHRRARIEANLPAGTLGREESNA